MSTKRPPDFARLINNCIIIYNNNSGKTVKTVYIPIILLPNILWHCFDAAFLLKSLKSTAAYSIIDVKQWGQIDNSGEIAVSWHGV